MVSPEPAEDAAHLGRLIDRGVRTEPDGAIAVPSGSDRADFVFLTKDRLGRRYPEISLAGLPERGGAGLVLATADLAAAEKAVGSAGRRSGAAVCVTPAAANSTLLVFVGRQPEVTNLSGRQRAGRDGARRRGRSCDGQQPRRLGYR